jgi:UDP-N-acetylmuramate--alanine ligase
MARRRGVAVTGCDTDPGAAADVARAGAEIRRGHDPSHVAGARAVVYTAAVSAEHPELEAARKAGIPVVRRAAALGEFVADGTVVAVAGTHGKTTTTVMLTEALAAAGRNPTGLAGGRVGAWNGNARHGGHSLYVVEADEYDKSFLDLRPTVAVVNNVEADHLECYDSSLEALEAAFAEFAGRAQRVLVGADDAGALRVSRAVTPPVWRVGFAAGAELRLSDLRQWPDGSSARLSQPGGATVDLRLSVPGVHNLRNAAMAVGAAVALDAPVEPVLRALSRFAGVGRRFERIGEAREVLVVDDYAHHPTEVAATLGAARQRYPEARLVAVFQPHLYSRTASHGEALGVALALADLVVVTDVYGARERPLPGVTGETVARAAERAGARTVWAPGRSGLAATVAGLVRAGDVVLTLGAGDVTGVGPELLARLRGEAA